MLPFREIWLVDFEFVARPGERPVPVCLVAREYRSGRTLRLWRDQMGPAPPYAIDAGALFVAYFVSAELGCHLALGWPMPARILDLFAEFRNHTNGHDLPAGKGLVGALAYFGLDGISAGDKHYMRDLILGGGSWDAGDRRAILDYCQTDVDALAKLLPVLEPRLDVPRGLLRGRYTAAVARMEWEGVPIEIALLERLRGSWGDIQDRLIEAVDRDYGVFEGRTFKAARFAGYLAAAGLPWPRTETGRLELSDDAFRQMSKAHPEVAPLRELRSSLSDMRLNDLAVGADGRNRTLLSPFGGRTGRNQPSNTKFIFGPSVWLRGLIKPSPGHAVAYVDWKQQEFGIAAALSGDGDMIEAYRSGDPYLAFAKQAGVAPAGATKDTHAAVREQFKQCTLAVGYGMQAPSLADRIGQPPARAYDLLRLHRESYPRFWRWAEGAVDYANLHLQIHTVFGWRLNVTSRANARSLQNFPCQANGAEMLRLACCLATERGVEVCAPVHDALLICARLDDLEEVIATTRDAMAEASRVVLAGFELGTDVSVVRYPDRYQDPRGRVMWSRVMGLLEHQDQQSRELVLMNL